MKRIHVVCLVVIPCFFVVEVVAQSGWFLQSSGITTLSLLNIPSVA